MDNHHTRKNIMDKKNDTVRGNPRYMTSYRSELAGIISLLKYIKKWTLKHPN